MRRIKKRTRRIIDDSPGTYKDDVHQDEADCRFDKSPVHSNPSRGTLISYALKNLAKLRRGGSPMQTWNCLVSVSEALNAGATFHQLGTSKDELEKFREGESVKIYAKRILDAIRRKEESPLALKKIVEGGFVEYDELKTTKHEIDKLFQEYCEQ